MGVLPGIGGLPALGPRFGIADVAEYPNPSNQVSSHSVPLPSGISSGDLLIGIFGIQGSVGINVPSGWDSAFYSASGTSNNSHRRMRVIYRVADGGEGGTVTITTTGGPVGGGTGGYLRGYVLRVEGSTGVVYASAATASASGVPNTDSLSPAPGLGDYLWFSTFSGSLSGGTDTGPTGYDLLYPGSNIYPTIAVKQSTASSEDPGAFPTSSMYYVGATLAIQAA